MRHWTTLLEVQRDGFDIILDTTGEDSDPRDFYDGSIYDTQKICEDIDAGRLDWFVARARVLVDGIEIGDYSLGQILYEDMQDFLKSDIAEDIIFNALEEAKERLTDLAHKFTMLAIKHS
jgi:hypothetical protein